MPASCYPAMLREETPAGKKSIVETSDNTTSLFLTSRHYKNCRCEHCEPCSISGEATPLFYLSSSATFLTIDSLYSTGWLTAELKKRCPKKIWYK
jgi:hypothetical protein